ncbi:MAG: carboxyl transferase domain-containing protein, partial [Aeromicrobium sp.]
MSDHEIEVHPELHTTAGKLADFIDRRDTALVEMAERAHEKQSARGRQSARERIDQLLDEGSFVELDALARHRATDFGLD